MRRGTRMGGQMEIAAAAGTEFSGQQPGYRQFRPLNNCCLVCSTARETVSTAEIGIARLG
jgi:hypothetical protein